MSDHQFAGWVHDGELPPDRQAWQDEADRAIRLATTCPKCEHNLGRHTPSDICAECLAPCDGFHGVNP